MMKNTASLCWPCRVTASPMATGWRVVVSASARNPAGLTKRNVGIVTSSEAIEGEGWSMVGMESCDADSNDTCGLPNIDRTCVYQDRVTAAPPVTVVGAGAIVGMWVCSFVIVMPLLRTTQHGP